jgi:hypothetical protein
VSHGIAISARYDHHQSAVLGGYVMTSHTRTINNTAWRFRYIHYKRRLVEVVAYRTETGGEAAHHWKHADQ